MQSQPIDLSRSSIRIFFVSFSCILASSSCMLACILSPTLLSCECTPLTQISCCFFLCMQIRVGYMLGALSVLCPQYHEHRKSCIRSSALLPHCMCCCTCVMCHQASKQWIHVSFSLPSLHAFDHPCLLPLLSVLPLLLLSRTHSLIHPPTYTYVELDLDPTRHAGVGARTPRRPE